MKQRHFKCRFNFMLIKLYVQSNLPYFNLTILTLYAILISTDEGKHLKPERDQNV